MKVMYRVGFSLYYLPSSELVGSRNVMYCFIGRWYVSKHVVNTEALVFRAWRSRECYDSRSVVT